MQTRICRMVTGLSVVLLAVCLGVLAYGRSRLQQAGEEVARLQIEAGASEQLREANRELERLRLQMDELERLRRETQEIHRLRGQYQEWQRLRKDYAALEQENAQLKALNQQLASQHQSLRGQFQSLVTARPQTGTVQTTPIPPSWLGISIQSLSENPGIQSQAAGIQEGVIVTTVIPDGPAEAVGLRAGDIITALDGRPMATAQQLRDEMQTRQIGQRVVLDVYRDGLILKMGINSEAFPTAP